jgi:SAM-dependent methyltransferase
LDIGAGIGTYSLPLLREGSSVTALDISAKSLEIYHMLACKENLESRLTLSCQKAEGLESVDQYDMVLTRHVLHHVDNIAEVARRIHRSLRENGTAIFLEPNPLCPYWYPYLTFHPHRSWKVEHGILRCFPWMLIRHFRNAGFREIELTNYGAFPPFVVNRFGSLIALEDPLASVPWLRRFLALTLLKVRK